MIGSVAVAGRARMQAADLRAVEDRQVQVENEQVGRRVAHGLEGRVAAGHDLHDGVPGALQRVLDELRDVRLVVDDENAGQGGRRQVTASR